MAPPIPPHAQIQPPAIGQAPPVAPPIAAHQAAPVAPPAPAGVGRVPDSLGPEAVGTTNSWIVLGVRWIWAQISWVIQKICGCFFKSPLSAPPAPGSSSVNQLPPVAPQQAARPNRHQILLERFRTRISDEEILAYFGAYFPTEAERDAIYFRFGEASGISFWSWTSNENKILAKIEKGKEMVQGEPSLVLSHLMRRVEAVLNQRPE